MSTCRCNGIRHPFESAMDYQTTSGTSSNIGQYHKESVAGVLTGGIGQITTTNGFNDPPKGYVAPSPEEMKKILEGMFKTTPTEIHSQKIEQGWECPRCKDINAPFVNKCGCK